jgi:hypothetical protein
VNLSSNLQAVLFIAGMSMIVGGAAFALAILTGLIMADPEPPTTNEGND